MTVAALAVAAMWPTDRPTDPAQAESCDDLADRFIALDQELLDRIGDRTVGDYERLARTPPEWLVDINATFREFAPRGAELDCPVGTVEELICEGSADLEASGPAGEDVIDRLQDNLCTS